MFKGALKETIKNTTLMMRKNYRSLKQIKENEKRWKKSGLRKKIWTLKLSVRKSKIWNEMLLKNPNRIRPEQVRRGRLRRVQKSEQGSS